jgi:hypothetical protein
MAAPMTLREIAEREGTTPAAINVLLGRALKKLRKRGLLITCRELSAILERNRATEHVVRRTVRGR